MPMMADGESVIHDRLQLGPGIHDVAMVNKRVKFSFGPDRI